MRLLTSLIFILFVTNFSFAQKKNYQVSAVGFYNLENLFDTLDTEMVNDSEFTPNGSKLWDNTKYNEKISNMARVISMMGADKTKDGVSILGVSETENRSVLEDLVAHPILRKRNYQIAHHDSPDKRGIDVGLLYNPKNFVFESSQSLPLFLFEEDSTRIFTRDILYVKGKLHDNTVHVFVNHWPSRRGGEKRSSPLREAAAQRCKTTIDSIYAEEPNANIIIMGDLNDDPTSPSVTKVLGAVGDKDKALKHNKMYNAMYSFYKRGIGSNAYRDNWSLFDQIVISKDLLDKSKNELFHYDTKIFNKKFLIQKSGKYKGYPMRTFSGDSYQGGYSDHFPVIIYLLKEV